MRARLHPRPLPLILVVAAALALGNPPAAAVSGWTGPSTVMHGPVSDATLAMDVDAADHTRIIGTDSLGLYERTDRTGSWHTTRISDLTFEAGIAVAFDPAHHAFVAGIQDEALVLFTDVAGGSNHGWPTDPVAVPTLHRVREVAIAVRGGAIHIAYTGTSMHLHHVSDASGSWVETAVDGNIAMSPSIAIDSHGQARIAYAIGDPVPHRIATEHGSPAAPYFTFRGFGDPGPYESIQQLIAIDGHDRTHIAYVRGNICPGAGDDCHPYGPGTGTYYTRDTGSRWTTPMRASSDLRIFGLVLDHHARATIVTARVRVTRETSSGDFHSTFLYEPVADRHEVMSAAIDLGPGAHARVVFGDELPIGSTHHHESRVFLMRQR